MLGVADELCGAVPEVCGAGGVWGACVSNAVWVGTGDGGTALRKKFIAPKTLNLTSICSATITADPERHFAEVATTYNYDDHENECKIIIIIIIRTILILMVLIILL